MKLRPKKTERQPLPALALLMTVEAIPGRQKEVEELLTLAPDGLLQEEGTCSWYALKLTETIFGIFASFKDESAQAEHLSGRLAKALADAAPELFITAPHVQYLQLL